MFRRKDRLYVWRKMARIGRLLAQDGQIAGGSGNLSMKYRDRIWYTKTGALLGELGFWDITTDEKHATREAVVHERIYIRCPDAGAVVHTHPLEVIGLTLRHTGGWMFLEDVEGRYFFPEGVRIVWIDRSLAIGSRELAYRVSEELQWQVRKNGYGACIVAHHGLFTAGRTIEEAYSIASTVFKSAKILVDLERSGERVRIY